MDIEFKINDFEGPLDLLLHLIKESKMDIMDIQIEVITKQYIDFLDKQEKMNLEVSSEYLVLASELIEIKSKLLLPNNKLGVKNKMIHEILNIAFYLKTKHPSSKVKIFSFPKDW